MKRKQSRDIPPQPAPGLGERLKNARLSAGFETQRPFANHLRVSAGLVGQWETEEKIPGRDLLHEIARVTFTSMEELWDGKPTNVTKRALRPDEVQLLRLYERLPTRARKAAIEVFSGFVLSIVREGRQATRAVS